MVKSCCAVDCTNRLTKGSTLSFYRFPADVERRRLWIAAINKRDLKPNEYSYICSAHFVSGKKSNEELSPNYVPSIFHHVSSSLKRRKYADLHAYHRRKQANRARVESAMRQKPREEQASENAAREEAAMEQAARADADLGTNTMEVSGSSSLSVAKQTNLSTENVEYMEKKACEVTVRETVLTRHFLESSCSNVPNVIKFYTGLPSYPCLMAVFNFLSSALVENYLLSHYKRSATQAAARRELEGILREYHGSNGDTLYPQLFC